MVSKRSKNMTVIVITVVVLAVGGLLISGLLQENGGFKDVDARAAKDLIASTPGLVIVDVREPSEYEAGHIPGSSLIPLGDLPERLGELDPQKPVLLVCRSGNRSAKAAKVLVQHGYKQVYNLTGGMINWPYEVE